MINSESKIGEIQALLTNDLLDMRVNLCANGFHVVLTREDEGSWMAVKPNLWLALWDAYDAYRDWKSRQ